MRANTKIIYVLLRIEKVSLCILIVSVLMAERVRIGSWES